MKVHDIATVSKYYQGTHLECYVESYVESYVEKECKYYQTYWQTYAELHPSEIAQSKANWWRIYTELVPSARHHQGDWKTILADEEKFQQTIDTLSSVSFDWTTIPANEEQFQQMLVQQSKAWFSESGTTVPA